MPVASPSRIWIHHAACPVAARDRLGVPVQDVNEDCRCGDFRTLIVHVPWVQAPGAGVHAAIDAGLGAHLASAGLPARALRPASTAGGLSRRQEALACRLLLGADTRHLPLGEIARRCGLSRGHFMKCFKHSTGVTPHAWQRLRQLERAMELLALGSDSIAEIASLCGFADQSHLTRLFRRHVGVTPANWRRLGQS